MQSVRIVRLSILFFITLFSSFYLMAENKENSYVYLNHKLYNIADFMFVLSEWDDDIDSPLHLFKRYVLDGNETALQNEVMLLCDYADWLLHNKCNDMDCVQYKQLSSAIETIARAVAENFLTIAPTLFTGAEVNDDGLINEASVRQSVCDLIVPCNILMHESTSATVGNITKNGVRFIHNFGDDNTFVGKNAGNFALVGSANSGFGVFALQKLSTGRGNVALGAVTLASNTTGNNNIAVGRAALNKNRSGNDNVAIGFRALENNQTGDTNTAVGTRALLSNTVGKDNTAMGVGALRGNLSGNANTAVGRSALRNGTSVINSTAIGYRALEANNSDRNTAIGYQSLLTNSVGSFNVAVGNNSLQNNQSGSSNVAVGKDALRKNVSGNQNIAIGYQAGMNLSAAESNNIMIGNLGVSGDNDTIRIGNSSHTQTFIAGISGAALSGSTALAVRVLSSGKLGILVSSRKFKHSISEMNDDDSAFIYYLNPVTFVYNEDESATKQYGLIAEEVDKVFPALVLRDEHNEPFAVHYDILPIFLLNEMKKYKYDITMLKEVIGNVRARMLKHINNSASLEIIEAHDNEVVGAVLAKQPPCDVVVDCNIVMNDSTSASIGNIRKNNVRFIHNFGAQNTFVGKNAGNFVTTGNGANSGFGASALRALTTGTDNTAIGTDSLSFNTIGRSNTAAGRSALNANSNGNDNVAVGYKALTSNTTGSANTAAGFRALVSNITGKDNTAMGVGALRMNLGSANTAVGRSALRNGASVINSTAIGYRALEANNSNRNTAIGYKSLLINDSGSFNVAVGNNSLQNNKIGSSNVAVGKDTLLKSVSGNQNIVIGYQAGMNLSAAESNNIMIGNIGVSGDNNTIRIGNNSSQVQTFIAGVLPLSSSAGMPLFISSLGKLGKKTSSQRFKHSINAMNDNGAERIYHLNPVTFVYNNDESATKQYGLIAEEVDELFADLVIRDEQNKLLGVRYDILPVLLLHEMKKHKHNITLLKEVVADISAGALKHTYTTGYVTEGLPLVSQTNDSVDTLLTRASCDENVGCNIFMEDSTVDVGNIVKDGQLFIHNFGTNNAFAGINAGNFDTTGNGANIGFGVNTLSSNTTGTDNTAVGANALANNISGSFNMAIGSNALLSNSSGNNNVAVGINALRLNVTGNSNTAIGSNALLVNSFGNDNTALGADALEGSFNQANANTAIGRNALSSNTTGINSTAIGYQALSANVIGNRNTAVGYKSLISNISGRFNTAIGNNSLQSNLSGSSNVAIGKDSLLNIHGESNIAVGSQAGLAYAFGNNNIVIGNVGVMSDDSTIRIGNSSHKATFIAGINQFPSGPSIAQVFIDSLGQLGTVVSSRKYKPDINTMAYDSEVIYDLQPVTFIYNDDESAAQQYGLIAEQVDEVLPALVVRDEHGEPLSVRYDMLPVLLLNELKKQHEDVVMLEEMVAELQNDLVFEN